MRTCYWKLRGGVLKLKKDKINIQLMCITITPGLGLIKELLKHDVKIDNGWFWSYQFKYGNALIIASSVKACETEASCKRSARKHLRTLFVDEKLDIVFN